MSGSFPHPGAHAALRKFGMRKLAYDLRAAYEHEVRHGDVEIAVRMYRGAAGQEWRNPFAISPKKMQPMNRSS